MSANGQDKATVETTALVPGTFEETLSMASVFAKSGFFSDSKEAAQAVVKMLAGRELGFPPVASMTGIYIVKGKVGISANLMAAAVKRSGRYDYRVTQHTESACVLAFLDQGKAIGESRFTMEDARRAGLNGDNWRGYPRNMLFARAMSNGVKWYCPDVFGGPVYTPEELDELPDEPAPRRTVADVETEAAAEAHKHAESDASPEATESPAGEKPPSYDPWGAIQMVTVLAGGKFSGKVLSEYFGAGITNKSALEARTTEAEDAFRASYDRLHADYQAHKAAHAGLGAAS